MNRAQFKDPVSHICLAGSLGLLHRFEPFYCDDKYFVTEFSEHPTNKKKQQKQIKLLCINLKLNLSRYITVSTRHPGL